MKSLAAPMSFICLLFSFYSIAQNEASFQKGSFSDPDKSIITNTQTSNNHKTLLAALKATNLEQILNYDGPFTVFAPSD